MKPKPYLHYAIILLLLAGILFRCVNLDRKFYWVDEVFTSLRISGYTEAEVGADLYQNPLVTAQDLQKYQYPSSEKNVADTVTGLATREPQLPPLYFVAARLWVQLFGNSVAVARSFSVICSLLVFPCVYWLCLELFASALVGGLAVALIAISPFNLLYAQEARPYSLWMLTVALSSWALLRGLRRQTVQDWAVYAITLGFGFYTFLFSIFVAFGHGIYVLGREQFQLNRNVRSALFATLSAMLAFTPWTIVLLKNWQTTATYTGWQQIGLTHGIPELILTWGLNLTRLWIDFDINYSFSFTHLFPYILVVLGTVGLSGYGLYFLWRTAKPQTTLFILTLIGTTGLAVVLPDLFLGGQRSATGRYFIPCYLGIHLAVAHLLAAKLTADTVQSQKIWRWVMVALLSIGLLSCLNSLPTRAWWNKAEGWYIPAIAEVINQSANPLVVNELDFWLFSLSHSLKPETPLLVFDSRDGIPTLPPGYSDYFLFNASEVLIDRMQREGYGLGTIETLEQVPLWQITSRSAD